MVAGPTVPPPPGLFSTTTGWLRCLAAFSARTRIQVSVDPPAAQGTINVTALVGKSAAVADKALPHQIVTVNSHSIAFIALFAMIYLLGLV
jgi:hypothetical protein